MCSCYTSVRTIMCSLLSAVRPTVNRMDETYLHHIFIHSFIHSVFSLTTGPQPLPKRVLHRVRTSASSFNLQCAPLSLRSDSSCLRLLPHLLSTSIFQSIFLTITCFRKQFLCKMWPNQWLSFFLLCVRYSSPPWLYVIHPHYSQDRSISSSPSFSTAIFQNFPNIFNLLSEVSNFQHHKMMCSKCKILTFSSLIFSPIFHLKKVFFLLNAALSVAILYFISRVQLALFSIMLPK